MTKSVKRLFLLPVALGSLAVMLLSSSATAGVSISIGGFGGGVSYDRYHRSSSFSIGIGSSYYRPYYRYSPYYYGYRPYYRPYYGYSPYYGYRPYYSYPRQYDRWNYGRSRDWDGRRDNRFDNRGRSRR